MFMKLASCAALTLCALTANAADQVYQWSFQGFTEKYSDVFDPDAKISGQFIVNDLNQDGNFDLTELKSFTYDTLAHVPCANVGNITCAVSTFSYNPAGALSFNYDLRETGNSSGTHFFINTGANWGNASWTATDGRDFGHYWAPETVMTVTAVPEPHSYLMLGAGLLALAGFTRRRNRK
ncbi:PEP-CTERM sorting domain-containing protein [Massilia violaceinigra]|uniref:PEP-CTERM sorting domain-containing protein n=1 Tax=Massilia violaceinigra TaxID=2045208 RepID=A0ABY3ZYP4_9BURK|nr:PEP-CTERM sorting domain-containing protein [Massilia violaceinigra]UOD27589.1 PEP-CTERM sorting domain-containing protein [Massilia violaceinigra]